MANALFGGATGAVLLPCLIMTVILFQVFVVDPAAKAMGFQPDLIQAAGIAAGTVGFAWGFLLNIATR